MPDPHAKNRRSLTGTRSSEPTPTYASAARSDPFRLLAAEHVRILEEIERAMRSAGRSPSSSGLDRALRTLADSLRLHARREDRLLYPICERLFGGKNGAAAVLREDHATIEADLAALAHPRKPVEVRWGEIERLKTHTEAHFAKEEHVLFPLMTALLSNPEVAALARRLQSVSES